MIDKQPDLDTVLHQLHDIQDDLEMYDPDYSGYSPLERVLQQLESTIKLLEELKRRN